MQLLLLLSPTWIRPSVLNTYSTNFSSFLFQKQIFCMGNPTIWWLGIVCFMVQAALLLFYMARRKRKFYDLTHGKFD